jgi:hypothetical protein
MGPITAQHVRSNRCDDGHEGFGSIQAGVNVNRRRGSQLALLITLLIISAKAGSPSGLAHTHDGRTWSDASVLERLALTFFCGQLVVVHVHDKGAPIREQRYRLAK